ncbi:MAG: M48 family metalloprotease [Pseudomonadales bacterium]
MNRISVPKCAWLPILAAALWGIAGLAQAAGAGAKIYQELREKEQFYPEEAWQAYVTDIGERLLVSGGYDPKEFTFTVLDNPAVNAFATPDGFIFVNRGLLAYLRTEDELAGVIGHEIGHVLGGHGKNAKRNNFLTQVAGFLGSLATGTGAIWDLTNTLSATMQSGYGRENELEADEYGATFLAQAGYSPHAMIDAIQVLKDHELFVKQVRNQPSVYHGLFSTHPKNDKRLHELVQQAQHKLPDELAEPVGEFWTMMDGLVYGDEAATGLIKDGVYYHGALRVVVAFPDGWDVTNTSAEILGRAPGGTTEASIAVQRQSPPATPQSPEEYVTETLKRDDVENGVSSKINGYDAYVADIKIAGGESKARKIAIIYKTDSVYVFRGEVGPEGDPAAFEAQFKETLDSFRSMTAADLQVANAQRIKVIEATPGVSYKTIAAKSSLKNFSEETLRAINGHHPRGEPRPGDLIKTVQ